MLILRVEDECGLGPYRRRHKEGEFVWGFHEPRNLFEWFTDVEWHRLVGKYKVVCYNVKEFEKSLHQRQVKFRKADAIKLDEHPITPYNRTELKLSLVGW